MKNQIQEMQMHQYLFLEINITFPTHENNCLDKIITDIEDHYEKPEKHTPIGKSRHCVVLWKPLKQICKPAAKKVTTRPMRDSCMRTFGQWITNETWDGVFEVSSCDAMAWPFENLLSEKYKEHFPQKTVVHKNNDKPWMNGTIRRLISQRNKAFQSGNMTLYRPLRNKVIYEIKDAKKNFYAKNVEGLKKMEPGKWHKNIRNITGHNNKAGDFDLPSLGVSVTEQADNLNDHFSDVCCQLHPLRLESLPSYLPAPPPTIHVWEVQKRLSKLNASKAGHPEDIPIKIIKEFSFELAEPLTTIFNAGLQEGVFPSVRKTASIIPVPKVKNPASANELRPIALTKILGRVFESFWQSG